MGKSRPMTALEASFLDLERPGVPMHVAGIVIVDGRPPVTMTELHHMIAARVRRLPKFHLRPVAGLVRWRWERVSRMNFESHLFHHRLPSPGTNRQLFALCARLQETQFDRDRPLWQIHLVDGLHGGGQALVVKTHHSITDGMAGIEVAEVLFDPAPGAERRPGLPETRFVGGAAASAMAALQAVIGLGFTAGGGPIAVPGPFNGPVGPHRAFGAAALRMDDMRGLKRQLGGSVDDVVVAAVAAGLRRYLIDVRYPGIPHALRAMLPVSTRRSTRAPHLGNHVTSIFVDLPLDTDDLGVLVRRVATQKSTLRSAHAAAGGTLFVEAFGLLPTPLHAFTLGFLANLPFANLVLSDVPGPDEQMYLLGRRIIACYPMMPLPSSIGLSIATVSMGGVMGLGVTADPSLVPNAQRVARAIEQVVTEQVSRREPIAA